MKLSEVKEVLSEVLIEQLNEVNSQLSQKDQDLFRKGQVLGISDRKSGDIKKLDPKVLPKAYIAGYNSVTKRSWWDRFNSKMSDYLGRLGSSRLR